MEFQNLLFFANCIVLFPGNGFENKFNALLCSDLAIELFLLKSFEG